jgi:hypothetical protein
MKKIIGMFSIALILFSCVGKDAVVLQNSIGKDNRVLIVTKASSWEGEIGNEIRRFMSEAMVGLPQPEAYLTLSQVAPGGFNRMMKLTRNMLVIEESNKENFTISTNKYAAPQMVVYLSAKDKGAIVQLLKTHDKEIIKAFKDSDLKVVQERFENKKLDDAQYKTLQNLAISLTIPKDYRTVDDTGEFLWLRQHIMSGIARGTGSNNILVYSFPLTNEMAVLENISAMRDTIGAKYIPGSDPETMHMITERAYTPFTFDAEIDGKKAYETRGKWEVENDFMAGPFLNYTILDKKNNRVIVFEGFTYAPSVNKREFVFELEAIAKSMKIK